MIDRSFLVSHTPMPHPPASTIYRLPPFKVDFNTCNLMSDNAISFTDKTSSRQLARHELTYHGYYCNLLLYQALKLTPV